MVLVGCRVVNRARRALRVVAQISPFVSFVRSNIRPSDQKSPFILFDITSLHCVQTVYATRNLGWRTMLNADIVRI